MKKVYSVFDRTALAYTTLFVFAADPPAVRAFSDAIAKEGSPWQEHPADYELHCLGELKDTFDHQEDMVSVLTGCPWRIVITGIQVVTAQAGA